MSEFVIDKKDCTFTLNSTAAKCIYNNLTKKEQEEIDTWLARNSKLDLAKVITILYGSVSQRRRMNPGLVKGVKEYLAKNSRYHLKVVKFPDAAKYIKLDIVVEGNKSKEDLLFSSEHESEYESVDLWVKQIDMKTESEMNLNTISEKVAVSVESTPNNSLWVRIKRFFKNLKRNLFYRKKNNRFREKKKSISAVNQYRGRK